MHGQTEDSSSGKPYGKQALYFTKELIMHKKVEAFDKRDNFLGWLFIDGKNLSLTLVEKGLAKVLHQAERSLHGKVLFEAEEKAKATKKNMWEDYVEPPPQEEEEAEEGEGEVAEGENQQGPQPERKCNYQKVIVTQLADQGPHFEEMKKLSSDLTDPPLAGFFTPKKGSSCMGQFSDGLWYSATVEKIVNGQAHVLYIIYGNCEVVPSSKLAAAPPGYSGKD